jgi:hypothetical protein
MKYGKNIEGLIKTNKNGVITKKFEDKVFHLIASGCKNRAQDLLDFDFEDDYGIEVEIENLDTEQYLERLESVFGYTNPEKMYTHYHIAKAVLGPTPLILMTRSKSIFSSSVTNPKSA